MAHNKSDDLFFSTLEQLHGQAPVELLNTLRAQLSLIKQTNPNCAQTAEACLYGLKSDRSTLLHVLTAAYLINGGVMLKHQVNADSDPEDELSETRRRELDLEFDDLEQELDKFSLGMGDEVKPPQQLPHPLPQSPATSLAQPQAPSQPPL
jgi:hypothetical protein